jgi:hypothetical protein
MRELAASRGTYLVKAYHRTVRMVRVEASSEEEAVRLVKQGGGECYDSEPEDDIFSPKWTAKRAGEFDR